MTNKEIYKIWAPNGAKWVDWVRPVPFVPIKNDISNYINYNFLIPKIDYINNASKDTAILKE